MKTNIKKTNIKKINIKKTNILITKAIKTLKLFYAFCLLLITSVIFTGCPEDLGPISPDGSTSENYMTADILGDGYDLSFDAEQITYKDDISDGVTIRTITGNMLLNAIFYDLIITVFDKGDGTMKYYIGKQPNKAKVKFTVSDPEIIDEFNINSNGTIVLTKNNENQFTGTFNFSIENIPANDKTITLSNGRFNYNHGIPVAANNQTPQ